MEESSMPQGLLSTNRQVTHDLQDFQQVTADDVKKLWQVYSTNRGLLAGTSGQRLENFFWRILSCQDLRQRLNGEQVASMFEAINDAAQGDASAQEALDTNNVGVAGLQNEHVDLALKVEELSLHAKGKFSAKEKKKESTSPGAINCENHAHKSRTTIRHRKVNSARPSHEHRSATNTTSHTSTTKHTKQHHPVRPILKKASSNQGPSTRAVPLMPILETSFSAGHNSHRGSSDESMTPSTAAPTDSATSPRPRRYMHTRFNEEVIVSTPSLPSSVSPTATPEASTRRDKASSLTKRSLSLKQSTRQDSKSRDPQGRGQDHSNDRMHRATKSSRKHRSIEYKQKLSSDESDAVTSTDQDKDTSSQSGSLSDEPRGQIPTSTAPLIPASSLTPPDLASYLQDFSRQSTRSSPSPVLDLDAITPLPRRTVLKRAYTNPASISCKSSIATAATTESSQITGTITRPIHMVSDHGRNHVHGCPGEVIMARAVRS